MEFALAVFFLWCCMVLLGMYVSGQKRRGVVEGALFTIFLGPIGILIVALLPTLDRPVRGGRSAFASTRAISAEEREEAIRRHEERKRKRLG